MEGYRYERKFVSPNISEKEVEMLVKLHPACFSELYPQRYINNLYFDTHAFNNLHDNLEGQNHRFKLRIRWYGDLTGLIEKPVMETKIKKSFVGTKVSHVLNSLLIDSNFDRQDIKKCIEDSDIPENVKQNVNAMNPVLFNRYRRKYYQSWDKKFRITVDNELMFYWAENKFNLHLFPEHNSDSIILELKYNYQDDDKAHIISSYFPFRMTKNSKYVSGVETLYHTDF